MHSRARRARAPIPGRVAAVRRGAAPLVRSSSWTAHTPLAATARHAPCPYSLFTAPVFRRTRRACSGDRLRQFFGPCPKPMDTAPSHRHTEMGGPLRAWPRVHLARLYSVAGPDRVELERLQRAQSHVLTAVVEKCGAVGAVCGFDARTDADGAAAREADVPRQPPAGPSCNVAGCRTLAPAGRQRAVPGPDLARQIPQLCTGAHALSTPKCPN